MTTNLAQQPFSRFGSYITVMEHPADSPRRPAALAPGVWLSGVHGFHAARETFRLSLWRDGAELPLRVSTTAAVLRLETDGGLAELCLAEPELIRIRCRGATLRLLLRDASYTYVVPQPGPRWLINTAQAFLFYTVYPLAGDCQVTGTWGKAKATDVAVEVVPPPGSSAEVVLQQHVGFAEARTITGTFDEAVRGVAAEFDAYAAPYRQADSPLATTIERAAWLNWSCVVGPRGHFQRPSMLMSKNWMANVWSWDHAINALALGASHPALAWDQLLTIFDQQLPTGQLPDFVNDAVRLYNYVKPPIHGWVLRELLARHPWFADRERLGAFYGPLARWTDWWLRFRLHPELGLPMYYHGNDSGWDNATVFDAGVPAVAPDAAAFLILQLETLADLADRLGRPAEAVHRRAQAQELLARLLRHLWDGRRFVVRNAAGQIAERSDSLFGALPIILGQRLPAAVRTALVTEIRRHLTEWGLATENAVSPLYEPAGYWRGPIWAPPTLIVVAGLRAAGEAALADDIAQRFCRLCRHAGTFAENFDARTGQPLCDPAYTWTSSVFLLLAAIPPSAGPGTAPATNPRPLG